MANSMHNPNSFFLQRSLRAFVTLGLMVSGLFQFVQPVLAEGTQAGQSISNTATATYTDPNNPTTPINTTSNTVQVTVAEVAGITVSGSGTTLANDVNSDGLVGVGDTVYYSYTVTNVGNDPTQFRIPNLAATTGPATVSGPLQISTNGGTTWTDITGSEVITASKNPGESVLVRVPVTIAAGAQPNDVVTVTLGDTPGNAQNQARNPNGGDVYTVDNTGTANGDITGDPVNGVREASDTQQVIVNTQIKTYALATVLKVRSGYNNAGTAAITDDTLAYNLSMRVEDTDPTGNGITPAPLAGTTLTGLGSDKYILVSDAIPTGTDLAAAPTPPIGWQVVYSTTAVTTNANTATWSTVAPGDLATVTRIGFVYNTTTRGPIAPGTTVTGFQINLRVEATATSPLTVANIAQLFGEAPSTTLGVPGLPVYDESGDNRPSNYNDNGTPLAGTDTNGDSVPDTLIPALVDDGFVNTPGAPEQQTDPGNNNSGTGVGGEANTFLIQTPLTSSLLNGPSGAPDATGPDGTTATDFTNKSALVPPNLPANNTPTPSTLDPQPVGFTNTLINNGQNPGTVTLVPQPPADPTDLPNGTTVTLTYGSQSITYTYNGTNFTTIAPVGTPIAIANVPVGTPLNYGVEVNLPPGTRLSTDFTDPLNPVTTAIGGFPVPIAATIDTTPGTPGDEVTNTTIDRVYTGYLQLLKESRILPGTGPAPATADATFSITNKTPAPGNIIEYRITYTNITEAQSGTGNVILDANQIIITEDGVNGSNNWARDNDSNTVIDTSNIVGSARDSGASTVQFFSGAAGTTTGVDQTGTSQNTDVTKYVNTVTGTMSPQQSRTFTFQRKVN